MLKYRGESVQTVAGKQGKVEGNNGMHVQESVQIYAGESKGRWKGIMEWRQDLTYILKIFHFLNKLLYY